MKEIIATIIVFIILAVGVGIVTTINANPEMLFGMIKTVLLVLGIPAVTTLSAWALMNGVSAVQGASVMTAESALEMARFEVELERERNRNQIELERGLISNRQLALDTQIVRPDNGVLPVPRHYYETTESAHSAVSILHAQIDSQRTHAPVPNTIHYKPSWKESESKPGPVDEVQAAVERFVAPKFRWLYNNDEFPKDNKVLLGYNNDGDKALVDIARFYSVIISGASRKGKSSLVRYCLLQHLMQSPEGLDILMCDPHSMAGDDSLAHSLEPLRHLFLSDVAHTEDEILKSAEYAVSVGQKRIDGDSERKPLMLIVDEVSLLMDGSEIEKPLGLCLKRIGREFAKVGVITIIMGQQFGGNVIDTGTRNCFTRVLSCPNIRDNLGRMIPTSAAKQVETLKVGQFVDFEVGGGTQILNFPETTSEDVEYVANTLNIAPTREKSAESDHLKPTNSPLIYTVSESEISGENSGKLVGNKREEKDGKLSIGDALARLKIKEMVSKGASRTAIVKQVWGQTGGKPFTAAMNELKSIIEDMKTNGEF